MRRFIAILLLLVFSVSSVSAQEKKTREQKVREDRQRVTSTGFWMYNDFDGAVAKAKETGKPIVAVLRCIPCEECVKLDDELMDEDPELTKLLEQFICVRIVSTNGLDLSLFQFDTDQSFAVFFMNSDKTIYGRFGTRSHRTEWVGDVSLKGFAEALEGALALHAGYPKNKSVLAAKTGPKPKYARPELFPSMKEKFTSKLNYEGDVVKSCIHCHQIGDAVRDELRLKGDAFPDTVLNPYPHPKVLGLIFDPQERATLKDVTADSHAAKAGLKTGDQITSLNGQPLLSIADAQWVLHHLPSEGASLNAEITRGGATQKLTLELPDGWKQLDDTSWRVSTWGMRRMVLGGLVLKPVSEEERGRNGIPETGTALRVNHVGQWGAHAAAKNAGFQKDDVLISFDGQSTFLTEAELIRHGVTARNTGDQVPVVVLRGSKKMELKLPMQP